MCVHGSQAVYRTTELCLSVDKLKKKRKKKTGEERCQFTDVNVYVVYILSTVETENTYTTRGHRDAFSGASKKTLSRSQAAFRPWGCTDHCAALLWQVGLVEQVRRS